MTRTPKAAARPPIQIRATDADKVAALALNAEDRLPEVAEQLMKEIERAKIVPDHKLPADVVAMGSRVTFMDSATGVERTVQLVYPGNADIAEGRISILTPIGAGLLGLREGQSISWPDRAGHERLLKIIAVDSSA